MSNRRNENRIRGPHSALTDFLAANNISAAQIRDDYARRRAEAAQQAAENGGTPEDEEARRAEELELAEAIEQSAERSRKRKRNKEDKVVETIKKNKAAQRRKGNQKKKPSSDDEEDDDFVDPLARDMYKKSRPLPGQLENCEICNKRFTVTPYSKTGPEGGLLCTPCGKELDLDAKFEKLNKKAAAGKKRRAIESDRLDGKITRGPKSLQQLCIEKVVANHVDIEEFGDLPHDVLVKLGEIFTKRRVLNSRTLELFLRPDLDSVIIHDAAYLEAHDFDRIFATMPYIKKLVLENACQFKDETMEYMIDKAGQLQFLQLYAANLVSEEMWHKLFQVRGQNFEAVKLQWLDAAFGDEAVRELAVNCTNLKRLKFKLCRKISAEGVEWIAKIPTLEHLSLELSHEVSCEQLVQLIRSVGPNLRTLSLERFADADDDLLATIHTLCHKLSKFRFSANEVCTDAGFTALFTNWANPPLVFADLNGARDVDNARPDGPEEPNGLASEGFKALMAHSGESLKHLNISSCRHISHSAFCSVFDGERQYPALLDIDLSFCGAVDTFIVAGIFKSCPALKKLIAFGCFKVEDVVVPAGIVLIGVPNAHDAIEQHGENKYSVDEALDAMMD